MNSAKSPRKVLIILASPRKNGNSGILAQKVAEGASQVGAQVESIFLQGLKIAPCNACDSCIKNSAKGCVINDDMQSLYPKIKASDGIVLASPTYWFNYSAQLKLFIDRTYAMQGNNQYGLTGKDIGIVLTYADTDVFAAGGVNALRSLQDMCAFVKAPIVGIIHGSAEKPGDIHSQPNLEEKAFELGKTLGK